MWEEVWDFLDPHVYFFIRSVIYARHLALFFSPLPYYSWYTCDNTLTPHSFFKLRWGEAQFGSPSGEPGLGVRRDMFSFAAAEEKLMFFKWSWMSVSGSGSFQRLFFPLFLCCLERCVFLKDVNTHIYRWSWTKGNVMFLWCKSVLNTTAKIINIK